MAETTTTTWFPACFAAAIRRVIADDAWVDAAVVENDALVVPALDARLVGDRILAMIDDAARVLVPGGELVLVYNSHLPYLPRLREVGPTEILARDRSYLVTRTVRT